MATIMWSPVMKTSGAMPQVAGRYGKSAINAAARFSTHRATTPRYLQTRPRPLLNPNMARYYIRISPYSTAGAVVVGGGPGGLTMVGNMLESQDKLQRRDVVWVDPEFNGGRVNARYREVPSNTKVNLFVQFAEAVSPFRQVLETYPEPNAITTLRALPQDQGCQLSHAADMCLMLTDGLSRNPDVVQRHEKVVGAVLNKETSQWTVTLSQTPEPIQTTHLILCPGASPIASPLPILTKLPPNQRPQSIDLDTALAPSVLSSVLSNSSSEEITVAVIGASHSAILVLMNLYSLSSSQQQKKNIRIKWFTRNKLRYAEYMPEGWILRDNTGLKGQAAVWARENLDYEGSENFEKNSPVSGVVEKIFTPPEDPVESERLYLQELPKCTHVVQAVGYVRDEGPKLEVIEKGKKGEKTELEVEYDSLSGRFFEKQGAAAGKKYVPGLFGAGIAFPEKVTDPKGNVEHAVGFWKFMRFAKRVVPEWVAKP